MSGVMGRGRRRKKGIKNNKRNSAEATTEGEASGLPGQPGSLTDLDLEGHHLAQQLLGPGAPKQNLSREHPGKGRKASAGPAAPQRALRPGWGLPSSKCQSRNIY